MPNNPAAQKKPPFQPVAGFNLFNNARFSTPNTNLGSTNFGPMIGRGNSLRNLQLALRLAW